jgi:hypothetical protein
MRLAFAVVNRKSILLPTIVSFKGIALYRNADPNGSIQSSGSHRR